MKWYVALALCACESTLLAGPVLSKSAAPKGILIEAALYNQNPNTMHDITMHRVLSHDSDCYYRNNNQEYSRNPNEIKADSINADNRITLHEVSINSEGTSATIKYYVRIGKAARVEERTLDLTIGESPQSIEIEPKKLYALISATAIRHKK